MNIIEFGCVMLEEFFIEWYLGHVSQKKKKRIKE